MTGSRRGLMVGLLTLVTSGAFEAQAVSTAMPAAAADLGDLHLYAWVFTAFMIPQVVAIVLAGRLCDRMGPTRPLAGGLLVFVVGIVVSGSAWSMPVLLAGRFVQGFGVGLVNLALMVLVGRAFPPERIGHVMTLFSAAWMLPSFVGPSIGAWLAQTFSWHWVFWAVLPVALGGAALLFPALRQLRLPGLPDSDAPPAGLVSAVAVAIAVALIQASGQDISWISIGALALGLVGLSIWTPRLMPTGWSPIGVGLSAVVNVRALGTGAFFGAQAFLPLMLVRLRGLDLLGAGAVITISSVGWMAGSWLQSRPWFRLSRDRIITLGSLANVVGLAGVAASTQWLAWPLAVLVMSACVSGVGMGLASASTSIAVMQLSPEHELGRNTSSLQVGETMGNALMAGLAGTIFSWFTAHSDGKGAFGTPFVVMAGVAAIAVLVSRRVGPVENLSARMK